MLHDYHPKSKKSEYIRKLANEALDILNSIGVPFDNKTPHMLERMALVFLAVAGITKSWKEAKGQSDGRKPTTKQIVDYLNEHFEEKIARGSYDDIKRESLDRIMLLDLILNSAENPTASNSSPTRGYCLHNDVKELIKNYGTPEWPVKLRMFKKYWPSIEAITERKNKLQKIPIKLPNGVELNLTAGVHNQLQGMIIDELLGYFGGEGVEVLYIGDTAKKYLYMEHEKLKELGVFDLSQNILPDVVAYNPNKNWLFLIEAFYVTGHMDEERVIQLKKLLKGCKPELIFITAFVSRDAFKKRMHEIAWNTEVWTADYPDHMVHFNGDKFLGPHK